MTTSALHRRLFDFQLNSFVRYQLTYRFCKISKRFEKIRERFCQISGKRERENVKKRSFFYFFSTIFSFPTKILSKIVKEYFATDIDMAMTSCHNDLVASQRESRIKSFKGLVFEDRVGANFWHRRSKDMRRRQSCHTCLSAGGGTSEGSEYSLF